MKFFITVDSIQDRRFNLIVLGNGEILIDNPGMRDAGIADSESDRETTFKKLSAYLKNVSLRTSRIIMNQAVQFLLLLRKVKLLKPPIRTILK